MLSFPASRWQKRNKAIAQFGREASLIVPRVYLSDYGTATDSEALKRLGITHVVSVVDFTPNALPEWIDAEKRLHVNLSDRFDCDILSRLEETTSFIRDALKESKDAKVLVHCVQGISRSATVVCAYVMATKGMTAPKSIAYVQERRTIVCPNIGFRRQLETYEDILAADKPSSSITRFVSAAMTTIVGSTKSPKSTKTDAVEVVVAS
ncbi:hypothetical protein ONZ45_g5885 [Pleurotus djamor]|nr:hypothetical protein ONZ45_g5885 [Pleurotus djamor]